MVTLFSFKAEMIILPGKIIQLADGTLILLLARYLLTSTKRNSHFNYEICKNDEKQRPIYVST